MLRFVSPCLALLSCLPLSGEAEHWAYVPPRQAEVAGEGHPVDALLAAERERVGVEVAALAEAGQWVERAAFTLTGLPPDPEMLRRIEQNPDAGTWRAVLDELLASPAYGERWARHWMDVARYADTFGYNFGADNRFPYAWTYRDWLIRAFNEDMPWSRFVKLQVAADLMVETPDHPDLAALGLLTVGPRGPHELMIDDRVDVITRGFMGTTVSCARCHYHKTDPISMEDYYSFFSILENLEVVERGPVIGDPPSPADHEDFLAKKQQLEAENHAARQALVDQLRAPESMAVYLELAWRAQVEGWDAGRIGSEGFKRDRSRPKAISQWRDFLKGAAFSAEADPRLARWVAAMQAEGADRAALCLELAREWRAQMDAGEGALAALATRPGCPLSVGPGGVGRFFDQQDGNDQRGRDSKLSQLEASHPGAPPRAMAVRDREQWSPARIMRRGSPGDRGEPFERHWLTALGGGEYPEGKSPRLSMAERLAAPDNPLTSRVIVNRVWAWHFGAALADPGDFGPQQPAPLQQELLDWLAVWFDEQGGSLKALHRLLLTSQAFRLAAEGPASNDEIDEANTTFWRWNRRRLDFESMRDRLLATAGALELGKVGGRSVDVESPAGDSRRSLYAFIDRYELPGLLVNFDLPHPDHHAAKRVETTVPQQALWFLNGPLPVRQARRLAADPELAALEGRHARIQWIYRRVLGRPATENELATVAQWIDAAGPRHYEPPPGGYWEIGYRSADAGSEAMERFPIFADGVWKTGADPATAPIRWLHAGRDGGHAGAGHELILRWCATGPGEIRLAGTLERSQQGGAVLAWRIDGPDGGELAAEDFRPESTAESESPWVAVDAGDTMDLVLAAPHGDNCGGFRWDLHVLGRESEDQEPIELARLSQDFPTNSEPPPPPPTGDVWADLVQILWASNEFNHLD